MSRSGSSDESSSDVDDFTPIEELPDAAALANGCHFRFDPLASSSNSDGTSDTDASDSPEDNRAARVGNVEWCQCGHCRPMTDGLQSVCCREVPEVDALVPEGDSCITAHPTYLHGCLNIHALEIAYYAFRQNRPSLVDAPDIHT
ncbi:uncharacterized protein LOC144159857 [Haemaphysalis longicornis]|uniref:P2X purinoreceptor 7 intracellular domain-containing protein n=1 Tax=Haemaphysalis longicornis TaxID=44386 RepID=A0A9J6GM85_HAELO|nr:hypothetical protein HPB48_000506 [Haemaphysalis longicornis]